MLSDAVIILANMRGGYINVGNTVHTLFRMSGRRPTSGAKEEGLERIDGRSQVTAAASFSGKETADR